MFRKMKMYMGIILVATMLTQCTTKREVKLVFDAKAGVGEGALWDYKNNRLLWIDITGKTV